MHGIVAKVQNPSVQASQLIFVRMTYLLKNRKGSSDV